MDNNNNNGELCVPGYRFGSFMSVTIHNVQIIFDGRHGYVMTI